MIFVFQLLCSVDPLQLRLTPADEEIYKLFREEFPDMQVSIINEDEMKSPAGKEVCVYAVHVIETNTFKT